MANHVAITTALSVVALWSWISDASVAADGGHAVPGTSQGVVTAGTYTCDGEELGAMKDSFFRAVHSNEVGYGDMTMSYFGFLTIMSFFMGLGKGGVPGSSTSSMALNSLMAPDGCITFAIALVVPATFMADLAVVFNYHAHARWDVIRKLLLPTIVGVIAGSQLLGKVSAGSAKLLIGGALATILMVNLTQTALAATKAAVKKKKEEASPDYTSPLWYADSIWFAALIGVLGGFATILTNSMGPLLNVFLLGLRLDPKAFVGTRASFFTIINSIKVVAQIQAGNLDQRLIAVSLLQGTMAVVGVLCAKVFVARISKPLFMLLEYVLMTLAASRLVMSGLSANGLL